MEDRSILIAIEILLPITWQNGRFVISGDPDLDDNESSSRTPTSIET